MLHHHHSRQQSNSSLREILNQLVNTLKHPFDCSTTKISSSCQSEINKTEETANAKLSQFEKTYVSFPEFVDISSTVNSNNNEKSNSRTLPPPLYNSKHQQSLASH